MTRGTPGLPGTGSLSAAVAALQAAHSRALAEAYLIRQRAEKRHPEWAEGDVCLSTEDAEYSAMLDHCDRLCELVMAVEAESRWLAEFVSGLGGAK